MGIKNLNYLIEKYAPNAITTRFLCTYEYKIIGIDISIYLYKYVYRNGDPLELFVKQIMRLLKNKVIPLYIFDGKPPSEKDDVLNERNNRKNDLLFKQNIIKKIIKIKENEINESEIKEKIKDELEIISKIDSEFENENKNEDISDNEKEKISDYEIQMRECCIDDLLEELERVQKNIIVINSKIINECKDLFKYMGIPFIVANGEAEALAAKLCQRGYIHGCLSEDTDILVNGGKYFLRNFNENNNKITEYNLDILLNSFEMTYPQFVDMCILCKCDYTTTITNIGREKAYKFIKEYKSIEGVIEYIKKNAKTNEKYIIPENFDYLKARDLFLNSFNDENYDDLKRKIKLDRPQIDKIFLLLEGRTNTNTINDIKRNLKKFYDVFEKKKEVKLNAYFN